MHGLLTDFYELTMAAGYFEAGKVDEKATFELAFRRLPANRNYMLTAGLPQAVEYLLTLGFTEEEIEYLQGLPRFGRPLRLFGTTCAGSGLPATFLPCRKARRRLRASPC